MRRDGARYRRVASAVSKVRLAKGWLRMAKATLRGYALDRDNITPSVRILPSRPNGSAVSYLFSFSLPLLQQVRNEFSPCIASPANE
jgi:hypothetical protein